jgi:hypothetical protein
LIWDFWVFRSGVLVGYCEWTNDGGRGRARTGEEASQHVGVH